MPFLCHQLCNTWFHLLLNLDEDAQWRNGGAETKGERKIPHIISSAHWDPKLWLIVFLFMALCGAYIMVM